MNSEEFLPILIRYSNNHLNIPALWYACLIGDKKAVELFVKVGISANGTALNNAIKSGNIEIVEFLINYGVKPNSGSLATAAECNNCAAIRTLLKHGADMYDGEDPTHFDHETALECAAKNGNIEAMQIFIDLNYDIDESYCPWDETLLTNVINEHSIGKIKKPEIIIRTVSFLLDRGADINLCSQTYGTPLAAAFNGPHSHVDLIALLINRGAEVTPNIIMHALKSKAGKNSITALLAFGINNESTQMLNFDSYPELKDQLIKYGFLGS